MAYKSIQDIHKHLISFNNIGIYYLFAVICYPIAYFGMVIILVVGLPVVGIEMGYRKIKKWFV